MYYSISTDKILPIAAKPQGRGGHFIINQAHKSGIYQFLPFPTLPDIFHKTVVGYAQLELLIDNLYVLLAKSLDGRTYFVRKLATVPWFLDSRYMRHIFIGINSRLALLRQTPEWGAGWLKWTTCSQLRTVTTGSRFGTTGGDSMDWIGCTAVP